MEKRRRAERLIASLRWLVIILGLAAVGDNLPTGKLLAIIGLVAVYNGALTYCVQDAGRFLRLGRKLSLTSRAMDTAVITYVLASADSSNSVAYLLYWFVLVGFGYASVELKSLAIAAGGILVANAAATYYSLSPADIGSIMGAVSIRSGVVIFGTLVSAYIAKSRSQDDLAADRGSYLHAILDCGVRLTSFRNVHELSLYVLESAVREAGAGGGELLLVNEETSGLECEAHYVAAGPTGAGVPAENLLRSYANWVISSSREFHVRSGGKSSDEGDSIDDNRPAIAVPILWQSSNTEGDNSVLGVLTIWGLPGEDFCEDALDILRIFAAIAGAAIVNLRLYTNLQTSFLRTLQSLANGLEARDEYTQGHSERVMRVACLIAGELGVPVESIDILRNASLLHDIGKIGVPDAILRKAGKLSQEEWETMRRHPLVSEEICRPLGLPPDVLFLIKHHHERIDGKGYPAGLSPQEQPLLQRILVVSDAFDAMRSRRPYRDCMPQEELRSELNRSAGRTMDPTVVDALIHLMDRGDLDIVYEAHDRLVNGAVRSMKIVRDQAA